MPSDGWRRRAFIEGAMSKSTYTFPRGCRVKSQLDFVRITRKGTRLVRGPLIFNAAASVGARARLGIRISRRCGNAVVRNRIKRLLREAYRLSQHDWPMPVDLIITVKPHAPLLLAEYQKLLTGGMVRVVNDLRGTSPGP